MTTLPVDEPSAPSQLARIMPKIPLLFVPGQLSTARLWQTQAANLVDIADATIADQNCAETIEAIATSILATAPDRFVLAAHGMGGFIAFAIMRQASSRILALALFDTFAPADTEAQQARRRRYLDLIDNGQFDSVIEERIPSVVHPSRLKDAAYVDMIRQMARDTGPTVFARQTRAIMSRPDSRATLAKIGCPTALIWGRQDGMATQDQQLEMLSGIKGALLETLEETGHFTTLERPRETTHALRALLAHVKG